MERIPIAGPWITEKEKEYVADAVTNAWYSHANIYNERFEKSFARYLGVQHAVALPSCTSAIHLSLLALGVGPGDEVIVPDITWIATSAPISYVGAVPVFADVDPETWCLSVKSFQQCITPKTKAVILVDLYGNMPDMDALHSVAAKHRVAVIEDAAEAVGSEFRNKKAGCFGDTGVFSFHGSKTLTTGEGGMLVTNRPDIYKRVLFLRDHGRKPGDTMFFNLEVAYKYRMSSLQAAFGCAQLERIEELVERKRTIFRWYYDRLRGIEGIALNKELSGVKNSYWMVTVLIDKKFHLEKRKLIALMSQEAIDCRPFFHPLSSLPAYRYTEQAGQARQRNTVSYALSPYGLNLPSGFNLDENIVNRVVEVLKKILRKSAG